jgi:rare lipoprotein A
VTAAGRGVLLAALALLGGCGSAPPLIERDQGVQRPSRPAASLPPSTRPGGYYKDDGPGDNPPPDLDRIADAEPRIEPLHRFANNPYAVFGVSYTPMKAHAPFRQRGLASWYGRMFHGQKTSSGEPYDMYGMTAAHPTLPIPSYVRVTHARNGRSVVVRVNDRGPFHPGRVIDLSYAAAHRLGYVREGSAPVEVELITPQEITARRAPVPADEPPVYVQAGAFSARVNAEGLRSRILDEVKDAFVEVLPGEGTFRVHVGPYRSRGEAAGIAQRLRDALQLNPLFVTR